MGLRRGCRVSSTIVHICPKHGTAFQWVKDFYGHDILVCFACAISLQRTAQTK